MNDDTISLADLFRSKLGLPPETTPLQIWERCLRFSETLVREKIEASEREGEEVESAIAQIAEWLRGEYGDELADRVLDREWIPEEETPSVDARFALKVILHTSKQVSNLVRQHDPALADKIDEAYTLDDISTARVLADVERMRNFKP